MARDEARPDSEIDEILQRTASMEFEDFTTNITGDRATPNNSFCTFENILRDPSTNGFSLEAVGRGRS